jgi:hypothetical protein
MNISEKEVYTLLRLFLKYMLPGLRIGYGTCLDHKEQQGASAFNINSPPQKLPWGTIEKHSPDKG